MNYIIKVLSGIGMLIALYLVLSNAGNTAKLVSNLMDSTTKGIKVLQGR